MTGSRGSAWTSSRLAGPLLVLVLVAAAPAAAAGRVAREPPREIRYEIRYLPEAGPAGVLEIRVEVRGLRQRDRDAYLEIEDWGSWTAVGEGYVTELEAAPPLRGGKREGSAFRFAHASPWTGEIRLS